MKETTDELDRKILSVLIENSKTQLKQLSRSFRIHPNTLLQRLKKLEQAKILMKYTAVVDFTKIDKRMQALMFLDVDMTKSWEDALRPLAKMPEVVSFLLITGEHDVLIIARVKNELHLGNLMRKFQATKVVKKTTTHLIVDTYREPYEYNPLKEDLKI
ncbi:putative HTH-type transcriptional regulator [Candidatus Bilamarchaeum dharawalense]|uniref:Putative HTH-type transcriptional regulator n=1 Tax=Candidatus Bilamarchaeum dharawalense TaxID=2885759 RepID=A0A5E4LMQ3_9ARCH|nr:putative HTH-type transcriptional regulator [Candidatus Bilamarchaeum dharawalense]